MKKLIVIADWAGDSLSSQVIRSTIEGFVSNPDKAQISFMSCSSSTLHTSFLAAQIIETEKKYGQPLDTVMLLGTEPYSTFTEIVNEVNEPSFVVARLASGMWICGPNSGHNFSLFKDTIEVLYSYTVQQSSTQFPARDAYSRVVGHLMDSLEAELDLEQIPRDTIPEITDNVIGHIDSFGNIITTIKQEHVKEKYTLHDSIPFEINKVSLRANYVESLQDVEDGSLALIPSAYGEHGNPYMQISYRRNFSHEQIQTAINAFHHPLPGIKVEMK